MLFLFGPVRVEASPIDHKNDRSWVSAWLAHNASALHDLQIRAPHQLPYGAWADISIHHTGGVLTMQSTSGEASSVTIHLAGGQHVWPLHIKIPSGIHLVAINGLLPDTPFVEYLRWRRSLDPARFDHWHPRVGPMIAEDELIRAAMLTPTQAAAQVIAQSDPTPAATTPSPPHPIPEPSTAEMGLVMIVSAALARRWARRRIA